MKRISLALRPESQRKSLALGRNKEEKKKKEKKKPKLEGGGGSPATLVNGKRKKGFF